MFKSLILTSLFILNVNSVLACSPKSTFVRSDSGRHFFIDGKPVSSVKFYLTTKRLPETTVTNSKHLVDGKEATKAEFDTINNVRDLCGLNFRRSLSADPKELIELNKDIKKLTDKLDKQIRAEKAAENRAGCIIS